jgi:hypothetical protein
MNRSKRVALLLGVVAVGIVAGARPSAAALLLAGSSTPDTQGWTPGGVSVPAATVTNNGTYTEISTLGTTDGGVGSGFLLYRKTVAGLSTMSVYQLDVLLQVVSGTHNSLDASVAFGATITSLGTPAQRAQMIYFDTNGIGWGDDTGSFAMNTTAAFHTYSLMVNTATGNASVSVDGTPRLTRTGYVTSDEVAFGDQTNDTNVNGDFRISGITLVPEPSALGIIALTSLGLLARMRRGRRSLG